METGRVQGRSDMPLLSRLDHLDFIMKCLEGKQNIQRLRSDNLGGGEGKSFGFCANEAYFKGSLLDRVGALEQRLLQLSLQIESSSTSNGEESSSMEKPCTLLTVNNDLNQSIFTTSEIQEVEVPCETKQKKTTTTMKKKKKEPKKETEQKNDQSKSSENRKESKKETKKTSKDGKIRVTPKPSWLHFRILGC